MLKVVVSGYLGQMGQVISKLILDREDMELVGGIDKNASSYDGNVDVYENILDFNKKCDVIIDFSHPSSIDSLIDYAVSNNTPLVIGTTGYGEEEMNKLKEASKNIPIFYSANMSLGINLILSLVSKAASILGEDFDIEIIEKHHNKKIDAPSGTAYMIANEINKVFDNNKSYTFGRHTKNNRRSPNEIGIHAIRGGTIVGEHTVLFAGLDEIVEIKHNASSKNIFAKGALTAVEFIVNKKKGLYNMEHIINK